MAQFLGSTPKLLGFIFIVVLLPLWLPAIVIWAIYWLISTFTIYAAVWLLWLPRGRSTLFVYSDSPNWQPYIEENILPKIGKQSHILNWSHRSSLRFSLPVAVFRHFGGDRNFNPIAITFSFGSRAKIFRFLPAFKAYKHGNPTQLKHLESDFYRKHLKNKKAQQSA